jgi:tRNA-specific 2-thiouridylase
MHKPKTVFYSEVFDQEKDQTYFLYTLKKEILEKSCSPSAISKRPKSVKLPRTTDLSTAEKKDSTGICFIGERKFRDFISEYIPYQEGRFETLAGKAVGTHQGAAFYTIGQRKGLKIGGPGEAWFVVDKDIKRNVVLVEQGDDHPALYNTTLTATDISWVSGLPPQIPLRCTSKIRYRQPDQECIIGKTRTRSNVCFLPASSTRHHPRQAIVFYEGSVCLGGALISPR